MATIVRPTVIDRVNRCVQSRNSCRVLEISWYHNRDLDESNTRTVLLVEVPVANRRRHDGNVRGTLSDYSDVLAQLGSLKAEGSSNTVRIIKTE